MLFIILTLLKSFHKLKMQTKRNEEQISYMLHQSRQAQMGEMLSLIAHQWRQPLSSISAITGSLAIDIALDNYDKDSFEKELEAIDELSQHLSSTINDFRDFFKENKQKNLVTIQELIEGAIIIIGIALESKKIELIFDLQEEVTISTFVNEVKQVILNILKNAEDILTEKEQKDPKIWIASYVENEFVYITIEDNAGGIDEKVIPKIFDPYFSTKRSSNGTGLGLYMSKTIINEHCKGKLSVVNTRNGAKFTIALPLFKKVMKI